MGSQFKRTVILWIVMILLFVFFYQYFRVEGAEGQQPAPGLTAFFPWILAPIFFAFFAFFLWLNTRWFKGHNEGIVLLQQGRTVEALERFKAARARTKNAVPVLNVGVASLQLWLLPEAVAALEEFRTKSANVLVGGAPGLKPMANGSLALAYALQGDRQRAQQMLSEAAGSAPACLAEVVISARAGDWPEAQRVLDKHGLLLDQLGGPHRALAEAIQALVASKLGLPGGRVDRLRLFRETSSDGLKQAWPELVEFIDRVAAGPQVPAAV